MPGSENILGYEFVKQTLEIFLQPGIKSQNIVYSPKVIHALLKRKAVSCGMLHGALLTLLYDRHDWVNSVSFVSDHFAYLLLFRFPSLWHWSM